jgi:hypothetical protein
LRRGRSTRPDLNPIDLIFCRAKDQHRTVGARMIPVLA